MSKISKNINLSLILVALPWIVFFIDAALPMDFRGWGIRPRHLDGLWGILATPFLHGNFQHLMANTGALFILLLVSFTFSRKMAFRALFIIWIIGGAFVWLFARGGTVHVGASGIIFGLIGFLMFVGIFRKEPMALIFSMLVFFLYGGSLLTLFVYSPGVSWSGHFFGFLSGVGAAWNTKTHRI